MRKLIPALMIIGAMAVSCDDGKSKKEAEAGLKEAEAIEATNAEMDKSKEEIEESSKELDELVNDL